MLMFDDDPQTIAQGIAQRVRSRRLELNYTQQTMARRVGVSLSTYRRFELTGDISLHHLLLVAMVLDATSDFAQLFSQPRYATLNDVINPRQRARKRGGIND